MPTARITNQTPVDIEFLDISYAITYGRRKKERKNILQAITGKFRASHLTAIMGPSGAGKSSLMDILAGFRTSGVEGEILVNGVKRSLKDFRKASCYILQDDYLMDYLTVYESMEIAAQLKMGRYATKSEKADIINEILSNLNMNYSRDTMASKLSGGERKRLCIAQELVSNPPIMFFDEPTSGMDSTNSYQFINLLKSLADEGRTIICTIHQPSTKLFEKFDYLYALAEGMCIYRGYTLSLIPFLASMELECPPYHNPADFLLDVASGEYGEFVPKLADAFNKNTSMDNQTLTKLDLSNSEKNLMALGYTGNNNGSDLHISITKDTDGATTNREESLGRASYPCTFLTQFNVLFRRTLLTIVRDRNLTHLRLFAHLIIGLLIGTLYYQIGDEEGKIYYNTANLFFCMMFLMFSAMMSTILTFSLEVDVFRREHLNGWYSLLSFYLAKTMADLPFQLLYPLVYIVPVYFLSGQPSDVTRFSMFTVMCILNSLVGQSAGLVVGAGLSIQAAVYVGPLLSIPMLLFSGFFVSFSTMPFFIRWLSYLSFIKYGFEGAMLAVYGNGRDMLSALLILLELGLDESKFYIDVVALVVYFLVLRLLGYIVLWNKISKK